MTSHGTTFGADGCPFKHLRLALSEFSEPRHTLKYSNVLLNFVFSVLALPSTETLKVGGIFLGDGCVGGAA